MRKILVKFMHSIFFVLIFVILFFSNANADWNKDSIFYSARKQASMLDLSLSEKSKDWFIAFVLQPSDEVKKIFPLITGCRVNAKFSYQEKEDQIKAEAVVTNLNEFLLLSRDKRKQLVYDLMNHIHMQLMFMADTKIVDNKKPLGIRSLEKDQIELTIVMLNIKENDKKENVNLMLPSNKFRVGVAGYFDGNFVFSEAYFLDLKIADGVAVSGDSKKFLIEKD